jgi:hypothetical protein
MSSEVNNFDILEERYNLLMNENEWLRAKLVEARTALAPFASIEPSSLYPRDGSCHEGYEVFILGEVRQAVFPDFYGDDIERARIFMKDTAK